MKRTDRLRTFYVQITDRVRTHYGRNTDRIVKFGAEILKMASLTEIFAEALESATTNKVKSISRKIHDLLPCIDTALDEGFRHRAIHEFLVCNGLAIAWNTYDKSIARARAKTNARPVKPKQIAPSNSANEVCGHAPAALPVPRNSTGPVLPPRREDTKLVKTDDPIEF